MKQEELTNKEKDRIKSLIKKILLSYFLFGILVSLVFFAILYVIRTSGMIPSKENEVAITTLIILSVTSGYLILLYRAASKPMADLKSGQKEVLIKKIINKYIQTANVEKNESLDFSEGKRYYISTENLNFNVREEDYNRFEIGDELTIYMAEKSKMILGIKK